MLTRRVSALAALVLGIGAVGLAIAVAVSRFPRGLSVVLCVVLAALAAFYAIQRRGIWRSLGVGAAAILLAGAIALVVVEGRLVADLIVLVAIVASLAAARHAFKVHVPLPKVDPPRHPVLFYNPLSGGGKSERFHLAEEARKRGIEPIELRRGDDLEELVRAAVERGADGLAMAGGDGSQAIVAQIAAELDLPYACIPAGTRNHFALDLGVDRNDVVGALDAFTDGGERRVDLAQVNGRVFVNNVSLGLYADAVQHPGYREAKLRTLMGTVPDVLGPDAHPANLTWDGPSGRESGVAVLVSNNRYRLAHAIGSGTRPRLDRGELGIAVIGPERLGDDVRKGAGALQQWTARTFEIDSSDAVPAGIDGEAMLLEPPLRFRPIAGALRARIAPSHPGASPSAIEPDSPWQGIGSLLRFALGREPDADTVESDAGRREPAAS